MEDRFTDSHSRLALVALIEAGSEPEFQSESEANSVAIALSCCWRLGCSNLVVLLSRSLSLSFAHSTLGPPPFKEASAENDHRGCCKREKERKRETAQLGYESESPV